VEPARSKSVYRLIVWTRHMPWNGDASTSEFVGASDDVDEIIGRDLSAQAGQPPSLFNRITPGTPQNTRTTPNVPDRLSLLVHRVLSSH
jgi:hypothetical protein